jgi:hypothetical protein
MSDLSEVEMRYLVDGLAGIDLHDVSVKPHSLDNRRRYIKAHLALKKWDRVLCLLSDQLSGPDPSQVDVKQAEASLVSARRIYDSTRLSNAQVDDAKTCLWTSISKVDDQLQLIRAKAEVTEGAVFYDCGKLISRTANHCHPFSYVRQHTYTVRNTPLRSLPRRSGSLA